MKLEEENTNKAATMMYFTDHCAAKQTRLGLGTVQNQIHLRSLGLPSGRHNPKVNLLHPLEKFTRRIYNLVSLKQLLGRLTLKKWNPQRPYLALFLCQRKSYPRRYSVNTASEYLRLRSTLLVSLNECSTRYKNP